jgi:DNA mismatch repair ATPase MutL
MKAFMTLGTAVLFLTLGTIAPAFAQQDHQEAKPEQQQEEHAQPQQQHAPAEAPQAKQPSQSKQQQPEQAKQPSQSKQPEPVKQPTQNKQQQQQQQAKQATPNKQQQAKQDTQNKQQQQARQQQPVQHTQEQQHAQQAAWQGHESHNWQSDHRTWQQRGGYNGYRIPDNRYNGYFGQGHGFVIFNQPYMVVGGFPRFQYSGYWFSLVDPWPATWTANWYQTDNVYVVYADNGYYMYNQRYPGVGIAISVSM